MSVQLTPQEQSNILDQINEVLLSNNPLYVQCELYPPELKVKVLAERLLEQESINWETKGLDVVTTALHKAAILEDPILQNQYTDLAFALINKGACDLIKKDNPDKKQQDQIETIKKTMNVLLSVKQLLTESQKAIFSSVFLENS